MWRWHAYHCTERALQGGWRRARQRFLFRLCWGKTVSGILSFCSTQSKRCRRQTPGLQHKADHKRTEPSRSQFSGCRMQRIAIRGSLRKLFPRCDFSVSSEYTNLGTLLLKVLVKCKPGCWSVSKHTNTVQAYHIITFVKSHKTVRPLRQQLHRCVKMQPGRLTDWPGCVNFRGAMFGSLLEMSSSGNITNLPIHTRGGWMGRALPARNTFAQTHVSFLSHDALSGNHKCRLPNLKLESVFTFMCVCVSSMCDLSTV